jgi:hypothetical protein
MRATNASQECPWNSGYFIFGFTLFNATSSVAAQTDPIQSAKFAPAMLLFYNTISPHPVCHAVRVSGYPSFRKITLIRDSIIFYDIKCQVDSPRSIIPHDEDRTGNTP